MGKKQKIIPGIGRTDLGTLARQVNAASGADVMPDHGKQALLTQSLDPVPPKKRAAFEAGVLELASDKRGAPVEDYVAGVIELTADLYAKPAKSFISHCTPLTRRVGVSHVRMMANF